MQRKIDGFASASRAPDSDEHFLYSIPYSHFYPLRLTQVLLNPGSNAAKRQQLEANFKRYLDGFSDNVTDMF